MRRHHLTSVAAIALALGMTTAGAQNVDQHVDQRRTSDPGKQTDQLGNDRQPQISGQSQDTPSQQRRDPDNRQDAQNATDRQQDNRQSEQGSNQQQGAPQQNAPATSGQSQENARQNQQGQNPQQRAQAPQQSTQSKSGQDAADHEQGDRQPEQKPNQQKGAQQQNAPVTSGQSQENAREPQQGQDPQQPRPARSQQGAQEPRQGGEKQQGAENEQADKSGRIALDASEQMRISDIIRQQRIKPVTNLDFSLSAGSTVPASVRLSRISGELADIFPNYRDFSFFVARQELVIVDSQSHGIVGFVPISGGGTVGTAGPREEKTGTVGTAPPREEKTGTVGTAPPREEETGTVGTAEPPAPTKKKAERADKKRVTEEKPRAVERETIRRSPPHTETDVTVGTSRRDIDEFDGPPPRDRDIGPPVRERFERDEGPPFPFSLPFSLFFGRPN